MGEKTIRERLAPWTQAGHDADGAMDVPTGVMSFASDSRGRPTDAQSTLYIAAVTFTYAVWENYVEDLAVELGDVVSGVIQPDWVPLQVREKLAESNDTWALSVHPGWRELWKAHVVASAKGDSSLRSHGLNTASRDNVKDLFATVGIDPVPARIAAPGKTNEAGASLRCPTNVQVSGRGEIDVKNLLAQLITVRGEAVHTARLSTPLFKAEVLWWVDVVEKLYNETDRRARRALLGLIEGREITEAVMTEEPFPGGPYTGDGTQGAP